MEAYDTLGEILPVAILTKIWLVSLLSGLIGLEREFRQKTAGLRTHLLVGLGSTVFTILSFQGFPGPMSDPSRVAAQIVTGIGFIGAGAILRQGLSVRGLTTAATLWLVAAIGMSVGAGDYGLAVAATFSALVALVVLSWVERLLPLQAGPLLVQLRYSAPDSAHASAQGVLDQEGWMLRRGRTKPLADGIAQHSLSLSRQGTERDWQETLRRLERVPELREMQWEFVETFS